MKRADLYAEFLNAVGNKDEFSLGHMTQRIRHGDAHQTVKIIEEIFFTVMFVARYQRTPSRIDHQRHRSNLFNDYMATVGRANRTVYTPESIRQYVVNNETESEQFLLKLLTDSVWWGKYHAVPAADYFD